MAQSAQRTALLDAMRDQWTRDLEQLDGFTPESIAKRLKRGDVLRDALFQQSCSPSSSSGTPRTTTPMNVDADSNETCSWSPVAHPCRTCWSHSPPKDSGRVD